MLISRLRLSRDLVRLCKGCGCWHSVKHSSCVACACTLSDPPVKKTVRDFSEQIALGDLQEGRLLTTFDFVVAEYPWPSGRLHLATVFSGVSGFSQLRKTHAPLLAKARDATKGCAKKMTLPKGVFGFFTWSPLRMVCMHYIVPPFRTDFTAAPDWLSVEQVLDS